MSLISTNPTTTGCQMNVKSHARRRQDMPSTIPMTMLPAPDHLSKNQDSSSFRKQLPTVAATSPNCSILTRTTTALTQRTTSTGKKTSSPMIRNRSQPLTPSSTHSGIELINQQQIIIMIARAKMTMKKTLLSNSDH